VLSRCQRHEFKRASIEAITLQIKEIAKKEKIPADDEALTLIARQATGSFRDAISLLDQMASTGEKITLKNTHAILGTAASQNVLELVDAIQKNQAGDGLNQLHAALDAGTDPRVLARQIVEYLRALLLIKLGNPDQANLPKENLKQADKHAGAFSSQQVLHMIREFNAAATDLRGGWQPALSLELALAGVMELPEGKPPQTLLQEAPTSKAESPAPEQTRSTSTSQVKITPAVQPEDIPKPVQQGKEKPVAALPKGKDDNFARLTKEWKNVSLAVKSNRSLNALLNSCRLVDLRKGVLTLGFASEILQEKANTPEQLEIIRKTIADLLGLDLQVKCVVSTARQDTPADIKQDGMVAEAIKIGGKIADIHD
jgi:DNA polymerase-3 subunit gamma/tau